jgi:predicted porin
MKYPLKKLTLVIMSGTALGGLFSPAQAQSQAQIYGLLDVSTGSTQLAGAAKTAGVFNGSMTTSFWGIKTQEDLGGGWGALSQMESFLQVNNGSAGRSSADPYWARTSWVGLSNPWGVLQVGRAVTPGFLMAIKLNPFGSASALAPFIMHTYLPSATQPFMTSEGASDSAWSNSVAFTSTDMSGWRFTVQSALAQGGTTGKRNTAGLSYTHGAFYGGLVYEKMDQMSMNWGAPVAPLATAARPLITASSVQNIQAGASYDLGPAKLYAQNLKSRIDAASGAEARLNTSQLGTSVLAGPGRVLFSVAHTAQTQSAKASLARTTMSVGYDQWLSKRTDVYVALLRDRVTGINPGTSVLVGLRHTF